MKKLQSYLERKLIKRQKPNFKQIQQQLERAEDDLKLFSTVTQSTIAEIVSYATQ